MTICPRLPEPGATLAWEDLATLAGGLPLSLEYQHGDREKFREGTVRLGWNARGLLVHARMKDDEVFTRATADQQNMWALGDVFELFLKQSDREDYFELHTTPAGYRLQLHFPESGRIEAIRNGTEKLANFVVEEKLFDFLVRTTEEGWEVLALVPAGNFGVENLAGCRMQISFGRYDYGSGEEGPVLSSTTAHEILNFHRVHEWRVVEMGS